MTVYDNVRRLADEQDITFEELAGSANVSVASIYRWKSHEPKLYSVARVADRLYAKVDDLLEGVDYEVEEY